MSDFFHEAMPLRRWQQLCGAAVGCWRAAQGVKGKLAVSRFVLQNLARQTKLMTPSDRQVTLELGGIRFTFRPQQGELYLYKEIFVDCVYDGLPGFGLLPDWCVFDLGANVGFFSLKAATACRDGRVYAFEPNPDNFRRLEWNLVQNATTNVVAMQKAAGSMPGPACFIPTASSTTGHLEFSAASSEGFSVEVTTLTEVVEQERIETLNLLKLDVEGAEAEVLRGAARILERVERVAMEYHSDTLLLDCERILGGYGIHLAGRRPPGYAYFVADRCRRERLE